MNWRDVHSFGLPGSGAQETCCWLFSLLSPSHMGWQAFGVWWDSCVFVCEQGKAASVIIPTVCLLSPAVCICV